MVCLSPAVTHSFTTYHPSPNPSLARVSYKAFSALQLSKSVRSINSSVIPHPTLVFLELPARFRMDV